MDYKTTNRQVYDQNAREFEEKTKDYLKNHISKDAGLFINNLQGKRILDLGSGPGRDALFFLNQGLKPLCLDISPEMIKLCISKGLEAQVGDLERLNFEDNSFDGVWAYTSLLHMPKANLASTLNEIKRVLIHGGVFYIGLKEGKFEGWLTSEKYDGAERFFSLFEDVEIRGYLEEYFKIVYNSKIKLGDATFLNYLCKKE